LIIPAATAKILARSLAHMFVLTPLVGASSVVGGIMTSYYLDWPAGPAIVVLAGVLFLGAAAWRWSQRSVQRRGKR
jgi:ABC-type Mn2+/Zn2+ transport system permease subunit